MPTLTLPACATPQSMPPKPISSIRTLLGKGVSIQYGPSETSRLTGVRLASYRPPRGLLGRVFISSTRQAQQDRALGRANFLATLIKQKGYDPNSPETQQAIRICRDKLIAAFKDGDDELVEHASARLSYEVRDLLTLMPKDNLNTADKQVLGRFASELGRSYRLENLQTIPMYDQLRALIVLPQVQTPDGVAAALVTQPDAEANSHTPVSEQLQKTFEKLNQLLQQWPPRAIQLSWPEKNTLFPKSGYRNVIKINHVKTILIDIIESMHDAPDETMKQIQQLPHDYKSFLYTAMRDMEWEWENGDQDLQQQFADLQKKIQAVLITEIRDKIDRIVL